MAIDGRRPPDPPDSPDEGDRDEGERPAESLRRHGPMMAAAAIERRQQFGSRADHARQLALDHHDRQARQAEQRLEPPLSGAAGGDWEIHDEVPDSAVKQLTKSSCVAACGEMLTDSKLSQTTIIEAIGQPAHSRLLSRHLRDAGQGTWVGGHIEPLLPEIRASGRSWAAELFPNGEGPNRFLHMVVVDEMGDKSMRIRDPWDGSTYSMSRADFDYRWSGNGMYYHKGVNGNE